MNDPVSEARYQEVLERRARALALAPASRVERREVCTVALVTVGPETFGVPVQGLREVVRAPPITPLPGLPAWLPGVLQLRGEVLCAVHLARWFRLEEPQPPRYLVVLDGFELPLGLLVGSVSGFRVVYEDELAPGLSESLEATRPVSQTTRDLVSLLDLERLVRSPELRLASTRPAVSPPTTPPRSTP